MNKKVILIFSATVVALILLILFSFGPLANVRKIAQINSVSTKPAATTPVQISNQTVSFSVYHNKDMAENYYGIQLPSDWTVRADQPGSYLLSYANGSAQVYLQDVADNTTLELFILSQDEPQIKKMETNYQRISYQKLSINNNQAYQLNYQSTLNGVTYQTVKTYIAGTDHAGVIMLRTVKNNFEQHSPIFTKIVNSFTWENGK